MPLSTEQRHPIMCITQDGLPLTHVEQVEALCAAGAQWIQLRMKSAGIQEWLHTARLVAAICREQGAIFIVNDSVEVALKVNADGVHLGREDMDWTQARRELGPGFILGGTVNNREEASAALAAGCLDYVGIGPLKFTATKQKLAPVLGLSGVHDLVSAVHPLPAWVIGGVESGDITSIRAIGATGVAVSSALFEEEEIEMNYRTLVSAWTTNQPQRPGGAE